MIERLLTDSERDNVETNNVPDRKRKRKRKRKREIYIYIYRLTYDLISFVYISSITYRIY